MCQEGCERSRFERLQGIRNEAIGNLIQGIMAEEGEKLNGTHVNTEKFYVEEKEGQLYVAM